MNVTINQQTKISSLIKVNKDSIEAIASLAAPLEKLRNPVFRKLLAGRITLSEAAEMGGCTILDFARVLQPLGFSFEEIDAPAHVEKIPEEPKWLSRDTAMNAIDFDVRPMLAEGIDPLIEIIQKFRELRPGAILCIVNSFVPTPLIKLLEKQNAESFTRATDEGEVRTYFLKTDGEREKRLMTAETDAGSKQKLFKDDAQAFAKICKKYPADRTHAIDVIGLEMPLPMHTILSSLKQLPDGHALYVYHKKTPVYLLEELLDEDYEIHILTISDTDTRLLLFRKRQE